jgi:outer membrane receptor protein involved in Fe transport
VLLGLLPACLPAQTMTVQGQLVSDSAGQALSSATVVAYQLPDSTYLKGSYTQEDGAFSLQVPAEKPIYLEISKMGYAQQLTDSIGPQPGQTVPLGTIRLQSEAMRTELISVTGSIQRSYSEGEKDVYDAQQFQNARGGTADDLIENLPKVSQNAQGELSLRGADEFQLLLNGNPISGDAGRVLSQLPADNIKNIEVITNPGAEYNVSGSGGIINIVTAGPRERGFFAKVSAQSRLPQIEDYGNDEGSPLYGGRLSLAYRGQNWGVNLSGNYYRKDIGGFRVAKVWTQDNPDVRTFLPSTGERSFNREEYGVRANANYQPAEDHNLTLNLSANFKRLQGNWNLTYENRREVLATGETFGRFNFYNPHIETEDGNFYIANLDYTWDISADQSLTFSGLYEASRFDQPSRNWEYRTEARERIQHFQQNKKDSPLQGIQLRTDYSFATGPVDWTTGLQYQRLNSEIDFAFDTLDTEAFLQAQQTQPGQVSRANYMRRVENFSNFVTFERDLYSAYAQGNTQLGKLDVQAGLRAEQFFRRLNHDDTDGDLKFDRFLLFPSANLSYPLGEDLTLTGGASRRINRNTIIQLNPFPEQEHSYVLEQGDDNLRPELTWLAEVGATYNYDSGNLTGNLYYRRTDNVINRFNSVFTDTVLNRFFSNVGTGTATGLDLTWNWDPTSWFELNFGGNAYYYQLVGDYQIQTPAGEVDRAVNTDAFQYSLSPSLTFTFLDGTDLQVGTNYLSPRVTAQGTNDEFYTPYLTLQHAFFDNRLSVQYQWQYIDLGLWQANEQQLATNGANFDASVNYIKEVDIMSIQVSWTFRELTEQVDYQESEMLEQQFE